MIQNRVNENSELHLRLREQLQELEKAKEDEIANNKELREENSELETQLNKIKERAREEQDETERLRREIANLTQENKKLKQDNEKLSQPPPLPPVVPKELATLVEHYNNNPEALISYKPADVSLTEQSFSQHRKDNNQPLFFGEETTDKQFRVVFIGSETGNKFLFPKNNTLPKAGLYSQYKYIFECRGYQEKVTTKFRLVYPAKVTKSGVMWELKERGELEFLGGGES